MLLFQQTGGTACPAQFYFVRVNTTGAGASSSFGTCDDETKVRRDGDRILVSMFGFAGGSASSAEQDAAAKERHTFVYQSGVVSEQGKAASAASAKPRATACMPPSGKKTPATESI